MVENRIDIEIIIGRKENIMKKLRIFSFIVFAAAVISFGIYKHDQITSKDNQAPKITMNKDTIKVSCEADQKKLLKGIKAEDSKDGDVTDSLIIESISNFTKANTRNMTVVAFDSDNHATKATRTIKYKDYVSPEFALTEPLRFPINTQDIMGTLTCTDVLDGDLTDKIKMANGYYVQVDDAGEYPMMYQIANSAGDVQKLPVTVEIYDPSKESQRPQLELSQYLIYISKGTEIQPWDYVQQITIGGIKYIRGEDGVLTDANPNPQQGQRTAIISEEVQINNEVDCDKEGVYEITYRMTDDTGRESVTGQVRLIVVVK